jgi:hypothetical protein
MPKSIQISKQSTVYAPDLSSYKLIVEAKNAVGMPVKIFVKQRIRNFAKDAIEEPFVAVCTPVMLEDLEEDSPAEGTSYYRTDRIELVGRTPEMIQEVFDSLLFEVKKLTIDLADIEMLSDAEVYLVSSIDSVRLIMNKPIVSTVAASSSSLTISFVSPIPPAGVTIKNYQYSLDAGLAWKDMLPPKVTTPIVIEGLDPATVYGLQLRALGSNNIIGEPTDVIYTATQA